MEQMYPGKEDDERHFEMLLPAFRDERYGRVGGKPVFIVYKPPLEMPDPRAFIDHWQEMARAAGLGGLHMIGYETIIPGADLIAVGYDAVVKTPLILHRRWVLIWQSRRDPTIWARKNVPQIFAAGMGPADGIRLGNGLSNAVTTAAGQDRPDLVRMHLSNHEIENVEALR